MLAQLQNLKNENYGFIVVGKTGWDDEALYNAAIRGEDISGIIGLGGDLQNLALSKKLQKKLFHKKFDTKKKMAKKVKKQPLRSDYLNLDTELDYYHSDGKTDFKGNKNTRTYIKDVDMGAGSHTSFGLVNLDSVHDGPTCEGSYFRLGDVDNHNVMVFAPTGKNCAVAGDVTGEAGSMTIFKGLQ